MHRIYSTGLYGALKSVTVLWRLRNCRDIIIIIIITTVVTATQSPRPLGLPKNTYILWQNEIIRHWSLAKISAVQLHLRHSYYKQ